MKEELIDMLCRKSFKFSDEPIFKLVSGRMSQFYVNCKPTTLNARTNLRPVWKTARLNVRCAMIVTSH